MFKKPSLILILAATLVLFALPSKTEAAEFLTGPSVTIGADEVVDDDVYASGGTIVVRGVINGDLVTAGGNINVEGTVNGDVIAAGGNINITGLVQDDVRIAGGQIRVISSVGGDVIAAGGSVFVEGDVGGDLIVGSGNLEMIGTVEGDARLGVGEAIINGTIKGNVEVRTDNQLTIGPNGRIEGNLEYESRREVKLESGAQVLGQTTRTVPAVSILGVSMPDSTLVRIAKSVVSQVRWFLGVTMVGLLLLWLFPQATRGAASTPIHSPWKSLGLSVVVLLLGPIALLIVGGLSVLVGGFSAVPVLLVPGATYLVLLSLALPIIALLIGEFILQRMRGSDQSRAWQALLVGAAILAIIGFIPILNVIATILTILFGFGAWVLFLFRNYTQTRATPQG